MGPIEGAILMNPDSKGKPVELSFSRSTWPTLAAGFLLAVIALLVADWPHSSKILSSKLCLSGEIDRNIFQMLANERARFLLKNRYYDRRGREAGTVRLSLSHNYISCLYDEAISQPIEKQSRTIIARSSLGHDLRAAIERIPFSEKTMTLTLDCDQQKGTASSALRVYEGTEQINTTVVLNTRKLNQNKAAKDGSVIAAGSGPLNSPCL